MFDNCELSHPLVISVAFTLFIIIRTFNLLECSNTSLASSLYMKRHKNKHCKSFWCLTFGSLWRVFSMRNAQISANFHFYWKTFLWDCEHWRFRKHINILYGMKNLAMRQAKFFSKSLVFSGSCTKQRSLERKPPAVIPRKRPCSLNHEAPSVDNAVWWGESRTPAKFCQGLSYPWCQVLAAPANGDSMCLTGLIKLCSLCGSYHSRKCTSGGSLMLMSSWPWVEPLLLGMCQCRPSVRSRSKRRNSLVGGDARTFQDYSEDWDVERATLLLLRQSREGTTCPGGWEHCLGSSPNAPFSCMTSYFDCLLTCKME